MVPFTALVGYVVLFTLLGVVFLFTTLLIGKLVRPNLPNPEKDAIYECGEPTIGSSWVQFDLRFYVVALLFVVFDVEVAFFFPWAAVFGKVTKVANTSASDMSTTMSRVQQPLSELGFSLQPTTLPETEQASGDSAGSLDGKVQEALWLEETQRAAADFAVIAFVDLLVFFGVVLVGFIYLWKRGDLDWVRALNEEQAASPAATWSSSLPPEPASTEEVAAV